MSNLTTDELGMDGTSVLSEPMPGAQPTRQRPVYDERDRLVILTPCFAHQVTTYFRDSVDRVLGSGLVADFRCADGSIQTLPVVAMAINQPNDSHIDRARNTILWHFEQTHYRAALFCDGDQPFEPYDIARTWTHLVSGVRVLGGCVALKSIVTTFAANLKKGATIDPKTGLLDANDTGTGWMGFRRDVLDEMRARWPQFVRDEIADALSDDEYTATDRQVEVIVNRIASLGLSPDISYKSNSNTALAGKTLHAYFASGVAFRDGAGDWLSEDWMFCHRCKQLGIPVKIDMQIRVKHFGPMLFPPPPEEIIEAALQVTSGANPPFDRKLAQEAREALARLHASASDRSISVLHATRGRPEKAREIREKFYRLAADPTAIEYIFAIDEDDKPSRDALACFRHVIIPPAGGIVRAINAAAKEAKGRVLVMAADDCIPPKDWDAGVIEAFGAQLNEPRVLMTSDGFSQQFLCSHPVMTREFYRQQGYFFCPEYPHLYCDTELTFRAADAGQIINARQLVFHHHHPMFTGAPPDALHTERNSPAAFAVGKAIFNRRNPAHAQP